MIETKYNISFSQETISAELKKLTNQIYKLLPFREEQVDWETPLTTILEELAGMDRLILDDKYHEILFPLMCKLEGLFLLKEENQFFLYRRTIFECLNLIQEIKTNIEEAAQ